MSTIEKLKRGEDVFASDRTLVTPTYVPDLVHATLDLLLDDEKGIWHLTNEGAISWHDLAKEAAAAAQLDASLLRRVHATSGGEQADTRLNSTRGALLRPLDRALDDFAQHSRALRDLAG